MADARSGMFPEAATRVTPKNSLLKEERMKSYKFVSLLVVLALGIGVSAIALAAPGDKEKGEKEKKGLTVGDKAPQWEGLMGVDDKSHSLADLEDVEVIVQVFTCNGCPVAKDYEPRLVELQKAYEDKGVRVVAINVNNGEREELPAMKERAEKQEFNFAYLDDPSQESARQCGARVTPHVFVLDKDRKIAYVGAFDDNQETDKVEVHYVRDAVDALLAGRAPEVTESKAFGCGIHWEK